MGQSSLGVSGTSSEATGLRIFRAIGILGISILSVKDHYKGELNGIYEIPLPMREVPHKWLAHYDVEVIKWNRNVRDFMLQMQYKPEPLHFQPLPGGTLRP